MIVPSIDLMDGRTVQLVVERAGKQLELEMTPTSFSRYNLGYSGILPPIEPVVVRLMTNSPAARAGLEPALKVLLKGQKL